MEHLKLCMKPGDIIWTNTTRKSRDSNTRYVDCFLLFIDALGVARPMWITPHVGDVLERNHSEDGVIIKGSGFNAAGEIVRELSKELFGKEQLLTQQEWK